MLIVEDNAAMRRTLRALLEPQYPNASVLAVDRGASALAVCAEHRPCLVLLDLGLPDLDGLELLPRVRALLPDSAIVVVSLKPGQLNRDGCIAAGADAYVEKDHVYRDLVSTIRRALKLRTGWPPNAASRA